MRILADENFPKAIVELLRTVAHDALWARTDCRGWKDAALLEFAESDGRISDGRIMVTLDKDFWQIAIQRRIPLQQCGVVLFRHHPATPDNLKPLVRTFTASGKDWAGNISIVSSGGIQMLRSTG